MARKALSALCVFFIFVLGGCAEITQNSPKTDFTADFRSDYSGMELSGRIRADRRGLLGLYIDRPETLSGLEISFKNGEIELKRDELICTADEAYLPKTGFPRMLRSALGALNKDCESKNTKPQNGSRSVEADGGVYDIQTDKNGFITEISLADGSFSTEFSNIKPLD